MGKVDLRSQQRKQETYHNLNSAEAGRLKFGSISRQEEATKSIEMSTSMMKSKAVLYHLLQRTYMTVYT